MINENIESKMVTIIIIILLVLTRPPDRRTSYAMHIYSVIRERKGKKSIK